MPQRDYWWCIIVAKYGAFLFTENGAVVITDYTLVYFTRRSSDIRLLGDNMEFHYPMRKKEISLNQDLKSWNMQEANFLWIGKVYSINIELKSGKWHHVNTRFNRETFETIYSYLDSSYSNRRKKDLK